jgi:hypothetical protein
MHSCAVNFDEYLREFEVIFDKALTRVSVAQGKLFEDKNPEVENLVSGSLETRRIKTTTKNNMK